MKKVKAKKEVEEAVVASVPMAMDEDAEYSVYNKGGDFIRSYSSKKVAESFAKKVNGIVR